jgi:NmrA-like family
MMMGMIPAFPAAHKQPINPSLPDKKKALNYARSLGKFTNVISVDCGWYFEAFLSQELAGAIGGFPLQPDADGYLTLHVPRWGNDPERIGLTAVTDDYGHIAHGVFLSPAKYNNKLVQAVSDIKSFEEIAATFEKVTGKKSRVTYIGSAEEFQTYGQKVLEDVREMFRFLQRTQGRYFDGEETEMETARGLKADAFMAMGVPEDYTLTSLEEFFKGYFGGKG